jgi:hypothetical protein
VDVRLGYLALEILPPEPVVDPVMADLRLEPPVRLRGDHRDLLEARQVLTNLLTAAGKRRGGHDARGGDHADTGREVDAPLLHADLRSTGPVRCTRLAA